MIGSLSEVRQARQPVATPSIRASFAVVIGGLAVACALAVVFGSTLFQTSRYWDNGDGSGMGMSEGAARWAGWTFLCGLVALGALPAGAWRVADRHRRSGIVFALVASGAFFFVAYQATSHWQRLLNERAQPRDYTLSIATGLPVVTVAASIGAMLTLLLIGFWIGEGVKARKRPG